MGMTHFAEAQRQQAEVGHLRSTWTYLGDAAGSVRVGANRIQVADGGWATPAHEHGREEEIFYVLAGRGLSWEDGKTAEVRAGDVIVHLPGGGAHTLQGVDGLDVIAFGQRFEDEATRFPRQGLSRVGSRAVETMPGSLDGIPIQWVREADLGPPELPAQAEPDRRTIVNVAAVQARTVEHGRFGGARRDLGRAAGSELIGLNHVEIQPGRQGTPLHCHSVEEEMFVILDGGGVLLLGEDEIEVRPGHVISRPAGSQVAHAFRAGEAGLTYLAFGMRDSGDLIYYPRSNKISFRGLGVIGRLERLDYWDGEE